MAPLTETITAFFRRSLDVETIALTSIPSLAKRSALSPVDIANIHRRADGGNDRYNPGSGARKPDAFNRDLFLIIFALIAAGMALTAVYFFFIARNGGFVWKENDWEDYKSTVLRRKGPDGKTLSNATKSTKLGGGSIVPKWDDNYTDVSGSTVTDLESGKSRNAGRARQHYRDNKQDPVFNDYVHEKPAAVGGYNKPDEGSHYTGTNTDHSVASAPKKLTKKEKKEQEKQEKEARKQAAKQEKADKKNQKNKPQEMQQSQPPPPPAHRTAPSTASYSYSQQGSSYTSPDSHNYGVPQPSPSVAQSYYTNYRPGAPTLRAVPEERLSQRSSPSGSNRNSATGGHSRQGSPKKPHRDSHYEHHSSSYTGSGSDVGTKVYPCHIPGISKERPEPERVPSLFQGREELRPDESVSQIGVNHPPRRYGNGGFRRGRG